jgi:hypothetical protein
LIAAPPIVGVWLASVDYTASKEWGGVVESVGADTAALIGAIGAVIGGVLTAGSNVLLEGSKARHGARSEARKGDREVRRAVRLVLDELVMCLALLAAYKETSESWPPEYPVRLPADQWKADRTTLADHLSDECWSALRRAYAEIYALELDTGEPMPTGGKGYTDVIDAVANAISVLRPIGASAKREGGTSRTAARLSIRG